MKKKIKLFILKHQTAVSIITVEIVTAAIILILRTFIGQITASSLLSLSQNVFSPENTQGLIQVLWTIFLSLKIESLLIITLLSLRTALILLIVTKKRTFKSVWRTLTPRLLLALFLGGVISIALISLGLMALVLPGLIFLFLLHSWLIEVVVFNQSGLDAIRGSVFQLSTNWRKMLLPYLTTALGAATLSIIIWYGYISLTNGGILTTLLVLSAVLLINDLCYLFWLRRYSIIRLPLFKKTLPRWMLATAAVGLVVVLFCTFVMTRVLWGISQDTSVRLQLLYDLLPPAETETLLKWQQQLGEQRIKPLSATEQQDLDELINQMNQEFMKEATASGVATMSAN